MTQAVIIHLPLHQHAFGSEEERDALWALEDELIFAVGKAEAGEVDGAEYGGHECLLFLYGRDADRLFAAVEPLLTGAAIAAAGYAIKRYGEPDDPSAREVRVSW